MYKPNRGFAPTDALGINPLNMSPEKVDHYLKGYGGGMYTLLKQVSRLIDDIPAVQKVFPFVEGEKFKVSEVPVLGDLWNRKDEANGQDFAERTYHDFKDIESRVAGRLRSLGTESAVFSDEDNEITRKARIYGDKYYDIAKAFYRGDKILKKYEKEMKKETDEAKIAEMETRLKEMKTQFVEKLLEMN